MSEGDAARRQLHAAWAGVAAQWGVHADDLDARSAQVTARMLARAAVAPGDRVLELACGPGGTGLAAAAVVGPSGEVVLSDVAEEMTAVAAARAADRGITNVRTATLDLEQIAEADESYDVVLCREGLMFAVDPAHAAREIRRVLRPGGRAAIAVWGPRADNPWLGLVFDAVSAELGAPIPPPEIPGPFSLGDAAQLAALLQGAGFAPPHVEALPVPLRAPSFDEWWARTSAIAGPIASLLAVLPAEVRAGITDRLRDTTSPYAVADGLDLPGVTLIGSGRRD
jgi:SAM-dependent methyltransferase